MRRILQQFFKLESASGMILFLSAVAAMVWANSPWAFLQHQLIHEFLFFINEVLMAFFFLLVGMELKRGFLEGQLSSIKQIALPAIAAIGGMIVPALIYIAVNIDDPVTIKGWATPVATDIAFALGVLTLFGRRVPDALKLFLLALAIFDDIGAILIIAALYSHGLSLYFLLMTGVIVAFIYFIGRAGISSLSLYLLMGLMLWLALYNAGVHPTIGGVLLGLLVPNDKGTDNAPLHQLEKKLHPWVSYLILPLFALANAGFELTGLSFDLTERTVALGIVLGLVFGKQIGVFVFSFLFVQLGLVKKPVDVSWSAIYGVALLCGIGFTMSLFLGTLSFQHQQLYYLSDVRFGVMVGSGLSGLLGAIVLHFVLKRKVRHR